MAAVSGLLLVFGTLKKKKKKKNRAMPRVLKAHSVA